MMIQTSGQRIFARKTCFWLASVAPLTLWVDIAQAQITAVPAVAQPAVSNPVEAAAQEIVVTGSRLRRLEIESNSPVNVVNSQTLTRKGVVNVQDAINELPQLGIGQGNKTQNFDSLNSSYGVGGDYLNLRNLGTQRTLVVVNGRRFIGGDPGTSSVDLNSMPSILVNRVDVVTGAASAVYGADAVSGVVNVILRDDYNGAMLTGHTGISKYGDAAERQLAGIIGGKFAENRGGAVLAVEYSSLDGYLGGDRPFGQYDTANFTSAQTDGSTAIPGNVISNGGKTFSFNSAGQLVLNSTLSNSDRYYQRLPLRTLSLPQTRTNLAGAAHFDIVPQGGKFSATLYTEDMFSHSHSKVQYEARAQFFTGSPNLFTPLDSSLNEPLIPANNPYARALIPVIGAIPAAGLTDVVRLTSLGQNATTIDRDTYRIVAGLRGDLPGNWRYDAYYQYGHLRVTERDINAFDRTKLAQTLNVNDNATPLNFSDDFCADAIARSQGCVPFNFLQPQTGLNQAVMKYIGVQSGVQTETSQQVASGYISGNLFSLPAGKVSLVLGAEYRKETAEIVPDSTYSDFTNSIRFQSGLPTSSYDVKEAFGELSVPLLKNLPFVRSLEVGGAARYSKYSTVGSEFSWSVRGEWEVVPALRLRGVYSTAVRAPNLNELYAPQTGVVSVVTDPCSNGVNPPTSTRLASCQADLGSVAGTFVQTNIQSNSVLTLTSGNRGLEAEKAKTYTLGGAFKPTDFLRGFSATVDYYHISIANVISQLSIQDAVNQCYDQSSRPAQFCSLITRDPSTHVLTAVRNNTFNAATESEAGLDVQANYQLPLSRIGNKLPGTVNLQVSWSHLFSHDFLARAGAVVDHRQGQVGDFKDRYDVGLAYGLGQLTLSWEARIYGPALADTTIASTSPFAAANHIPAIAYNDLQANFALPGGRYSLSLGMKNLFDQQPPLITTPARTVPGDYPTVTAVYDTRGRFFYTTASIKF